MRAGPSRLNRMKRVFQWLVVAAVVLTLTGGVFVYSGVYDIGADVPHTAAVRWLVGILRDRSIDSRAEQVRVPSLTDAARVAEGAEHYAEMCAGCHRAPGVRDSEIREGLYPPAPDLTRSAPAPAEAFWTIKHGIKMSGMPAWGRTHTDDKIWDIVAFLQQLPRMSAERYEALTRGSENDNDHDHES